MTQPNLIVSSTLNLVGIEQVCQWVAMGDTMRVIGDRLGLTSAQVMIWLHRHEKVYLYREAQAVSAEILMDKGEDLLTDAIGMGISNSEVTLLRTLSDYYTRRAIQRNKSYSDKPQEVGKGGMPNLTVIVNGIASDGAGRPVIDVTPTAPQLTHTV